MIFVDTNYFLRFLLNDVNSQHEEAKKVFEEGALGKSELFTSLIVFFEIYWVLLSFYRKNKEELAAHLHKILGMEFIFLVERPLLQTALMFFEKTGWDLEDAFNLACAKQLKASEFKTFDKKLKKLFLSVL